MSRYIDVEWLEDNAKEYSLGYYEDDEWATPLNVLDSAPSIDIVRCKECRHWEMRNSPRGWCVVHQGYVSPQYFCADGERDGE